MKKESVLLIVFFIIGIMNCLSQENKNSGSGFIPVDGGKIYYEEKGQGDVIVLLHPGLTDLRMWHNQVEEFSKSYKVVCYDQRGYGNSDLPSKDYSPNADLLTLLDSLKIENAHIVGICMGALHAMEFTIAFPERVKTVVLSGISFVNWEYSEEIINKQIEFSGIVAEGGPGKAIETLKTDPFWNKSLPSSDFNNAKQTFLKILEENRKAFTANWQYKEQVFSTKDRITEINKPVLVIRPENEIDYMIKIADYFLENVKQAEEIQVEGAGHLSNMEKPEEFNKAIIGFLNKYE